MSVAERADTYGIHHWQILWSNYRKLAWVGFDIYTRILLPEAFYTRSSAFSSRLPDHKSDFHLCAILSNPVQSFFPFLFAHSLLILFIPIISRRVHLHRVKIIQIRSHFWSVFSCIRTEYRKILTRNNSVFGYILRSVNSPFVTPFKICVS